MRIRNLARAALFAAALFPLSALAQAVHFGNTPPGGAVGSTQFNNNGVFGGYVMGGDCAIVTSTGVITCTKTNGAAFGTSATINTGTTGATIPLNNGGFAQSGTANFTGAFQIGGAAQAFPASGLLVGTTDTQTLSGKTLTSPTINGAALSGTLTGSPIFSGVPLFTGLSTGTQVSCLGLTSGNALALSNAACGSGGGGGTSTFFVGATANTGNAYTIASPTPSGFTFTNQYAVRFVANATSTGSATLSVNSTTAEPIEKQLSSGFVATGAGDIVSGLEYDATVNTTCTCYVLTNVVGSQIINPFSSATITAAQWNNGSVLVVTEAGQTATLPAANTLSASGLIFIQAVGNAVTLAPNAADAINGGSTGAAVTLAAGGTYLVTTTGSTGATAIAETGGGGGGGGISPTSAVFHPIRIYTGTGAIPVTTTAFSAVATFTSSSASIAATNSFVADQAVQFTGSPPSGFTAGTTYYVLSAGLSGSAFEVASAAGGSAISAGASGTATVNAVIDYLIVVDKSVAAATAINFTCPTSTAGFEFKIKDGAGNDGADNITLTPSGGALIDGKSTLVMNGSHAGTPPYEERIIDCDSSQNSWVN